MTTTKKKNFSVRKKEGALVQKILKLIKKYKKTAIGIGAFVIITTVAIVAGILYFVSFGSGFSSAGDSMGYNTMDNYSYGASRTHSKSVSSMTQSVPIGRSESVYDVLDERKVIKNGRLSLVVKNIDTAKIEIESITQSFNGFVQSSNFSENQYTNKNINGVVSKNGYFEIKIPTKNFKLAFDKYKTVALKVENEAISVADVTEKYSDLETQIKNKKAEEDQYRELLKRSGKIKDVLEVTKYLNSATVARERLQGRLNHLSNQVELSSISITIISEKDIEIFGVIWSPMQEIKAGFRSLLEDGKDLINSIIVITFKLPILFLWLFVILSGSKILWILFKKFKSIVFRGK